MSNTAAAVVHVAPNDVESRLGGSGSRSSEFFERSILH